MPHQCGSANSPRSGTIATEAGSSFRFWGIGCRRTSFSRLENCEASAILASACMAPPFFGPAMAPYELGAQEPEHLSRVAPRLKAL